MKKEVIFLTHTNYHFLVTISLITDLFPDETLSRVTILKTIPLKRKKNDPYHAEPVLLNHVHIKEIPYNEYCTLPQEPTLNTVHELIRSNIDQLIVFNQHSFLAIYLSSQLYKKAEIILAPDGAKPYVSSNKATPRWSSKTAWHFQRFLLRNRLIAFIPHYPTLVYGGLKFIDEVWVHYPNAYKNLSKKKIKAIKVLGTTDSISLTKQYFRFKEEFNQERVLLYLNQPFKNKGRYEYEISFLETLLKKFPNFPLLIKLHPSTEENQLKNFFKLQGNIKIINDNIPAELHILALTGSLVLSFWSTAVFTHNPTCHHYWLYPMLLDKGLLPAYLNLSPPSDHIIAANNINQINFP